MKIAFPLLAAAALATGLSFNAVAADDMSRHDMHQHDMSMQGSMGGMKSAKGATSLSSGEVKKIDKDAGKITIKHGPLTNLGMPAMTMAFKVKDPAMLDQVKAGDKIGFVAEKVDGAITVTKLEPAK